MMGRSWPHLGRRPTPHATGSDRNSTPGPAQLSTPVTRWLPEDVVEIRSGPLAVVGDYRLDDAPIAHVPPTFGLLQGRVITVCVVAQAVGSATWRGRLRLRWATMQFKIGRRLWKAQRPVRSALGLRLMRRGFTQLQRIGGVIP